MFGVRVPWEELHRVKNTRKAAGEGGEDFAGVVLFLRALKAKGKEKKPTSGRVVSRYRSATCGQTFRELS